PEGRQAGWPRVGLWLAGAERAATLARLVERAQEQAPAGERDRAAVVAWLRARAAGERGSD
ncbi:MAG: hypothetical protein IRY97_03225, partial [Thermomicrobiaceae bacterium]|nr:hypothetical protein [Thermomicrobiaceae bacterium]